MNVYILVKKKKLSDFKNIIAKEDMDIIQDIHSTCFKDFKTAEQYIKHMTNEAKLDVHLICLKVDQHEYKNIIL